MSFVRQGRSLRKILWDGNGKTMRRPAAGTLAVAGLAMVPLRGADIVGGAIEPVIFFRPRQPRRYNRLHGRDQLLGRFLETLQRAAVDPMWQVWRPPDFLPLLARRALDPGLLWATVGLAGLLL